MQRILFIAAIFTSAFLLFLIQPMMSKQFLPYLGGSQAVWQTSMLFYQAMLLLGYMYAHFMPRLAGEARQRKLHLLLLSVSLVALPVALHTSTPFMPTAQPVLWLLYALMLSVGLPFFVLSANAPMLQHWFSHTTDHSSHNPYFLYSASNLGSFIALLGYPFVVEPLFDIPMQSSLWSGIYVLFAALIAVIAVSTLKTAGAVTQDIHAEKTEAIPLKQKLLWMLMAALPSSLMLGLTTHVTTDLGAIPLLWVIPLALYLLSFVLCFHPKMPGYKLSLALQVPLVLLLFTVSGLALDLDMLEFKALHFVVFFIVAMSLHGQLALMKPHSSQATEFYLWLSLGGVLGGCFNVLLAPAIFETGGEYILVLALTCLHRPVFAAAGREMREKIIDYAFPIGGYLLFLLVKRIPDVGPPPDEATIQALGPLSQVSLWSFIFYALFPITAAIISRKRPTRFAFSVLLMTMMSPFSTGPLDTEMVSVERNFFGIGMVFHDKAQHTYFYNHGTTRHGVQSTEPELKTALSMYYYPLKEITAALPPKIAGMPIAAAGLGVGTMTCSGKRGQRFDIYEINPLVKQIAEDTRYFTYLRDCPPDKHIFIVDARIGLSAAATHGYGLMIMDAYSSDSIPLHLLTRESLAMYLDKLAPGGVIAFHVSNRYYKLGPVIARLADDAHVVAIEKRFDPDPNHNPYDIYSTAFWVLVARDARDFGPLLTKNKGWEILKTDGKKPWTDHYSNVVEAIRWEQ